MAVPLPDNQLRELVEKQVVLRPDAKVINQGDPVTINGVRVPLGEIDRALSSHPAVRYAATLLRELFFGSRQLVAYVTIQSEWAWSPDELREFLAQRLPAAMLPARFIRLETMPLTAHGLVDRTALSGLGDDRYVPPRNDTERRLCDIFAELFDRPRCGVTDDFFELGGDSLMSATLVVLLEREFHCRLSPDLLAEHPTIERIAEMLNQDSPIAEKSASFAIQAGGSQPPLFCLPGIGGEFLGFHHLAAALPNDRPVYGLRLLRNAELQLSGSTLVEAASELVREVRRLQNHGPYHLVGYSLGGTFGYEMACQLRDQGEAVSLLALLDTPRMLSAKVPVPWWRQLQQQWTNVLTYEGTARFDYLAGRLRIALARGRKRLWGGEAEANDLHEENIALYLPAKLREGARTSWRIARAYQPRPYPGRLVLFRAADQYDASAVNDPYLGWGGLPAGGIEVHDIPGTHLSMFTPTHIPRIAAVFRELLNDNGRLQSDRGRT